MKRRRQTTHPYSPGGFTFRRPRSVPWVMAFARWYCPRLLRTKLGVAEVVLPENSRRRLDALAGQRAVLTPNHPGHEPEVMFHASTLLGHTWNYLAAKEVFTHSWAQDFVVQRVGGYSIVRGTNDRDAFKMTRELIARGQRWLVVFPEGQDHYHSDMLTPFQPGVIQLCFWGLDKLAAESEGALLPLHIVPVFIRYHFLRDMRPDITASLSRLEAALGIPPAPGTSPYDRLLGIGESLLRVHEKRFNVRTAKGAELGARLDHMRELLIGRVASGLNIPVPRMDLSLRDRLRALFNALDQVGSGLDSGSSAYSRHLKREHEQRAELAYRELDRLLGFVAASEDYVLKRPTQERFCDLLGRLEREILGRERFFGPQRAVVMVGEALNLSEHYGRYKADKRAVVEELTLVVEERVRALLEESADLLTPLG